MDSTIFTSKKNIGNLELRNRIIRSATYEGACDTQGFPSKKYLAIYERLAKNDVGMIITGFAFITPKGRSMQTAQAGIDTIDKIEYYREITNVVHKYDCPIIMQIAHSGRQTLKSLTHSKPLSSTKKKSVYFREKPQLLDKSEIKKIINKFIQAAYFAKTAGFDGIQLHAAHGYLLHQLLLPKTNQLDNEFGIDSQTGLGTKMLDMVIDGIRQICGKEFTLIVKISGDQDLSDPDEDFVFLEKIVKYLDSKNVDAIEISYGTMDYPLNIFRGDLNLEKVFEYNPIFQSNFLIKRFLTKHYIAKFISPKFKPFKPMYNITYAERAKQLTQIPIISVGGFRSGQEIEFALNSNKADFVSLSRPFICEPDFVKKLIENNANYKSKCTNCNECIFMCDSGRVTKCYTNTSI